MQWVDDINSLDFYNAPPPPIPCYCDIIVYPSDLVLQGMFNPNSGSFTYEIYTMTVNGLTEIEDVTSNFEIYYFSVPNIGQSAFNARLTHFADSMCTNPCYVLRVRIFQGSTQVFEKYTHTYCQTSCCDIAGGITIQQEGLQVTSDPVTPVSPSNPKISDCGDRIITLTTAGYCYDYFTGDYYGTPTVILDGAPKFSYYKFTNLKGRFVQRPREITREYSYNCRLQRVESQKQYLFEGFEYFPAWKMNEIEGMLHGSEIYIDGTRYEFNGGTPFQLLKIPRCYEMFKLNVTLNDCTLRQTLGCGVPCETLNYDGNMQMFVIPSTYEDGNSFYDESGNFISDDYEELLNYIRNLNGITDVTDLTPPSGFGCDVFAAFSYSGTAYLPTSIYVNTFQQSTRIYSVVLGSADDICGQVGTSCSMPVIGTIVIEDNLCDAPVIGTITVEDDPVDTVTIYGYGDWALDGSEDVTVNGAGYVTMHFIVDNPLLVEDPDNPDVPVYAAYQQIATLGSGGVPSTQLIFNDVNSPLLANQTVIINTNGTIYFEGYVNSSTELQSSITVDLNYYLS